MKLNVDSPSKMHKACLLGDYLPELPRRGRSWISSKHSAKTQSNEASMAQLKEELSLYCQQLLFIMDVYFFHVHKLKNLKLARTSSTLVQAALPPPIVPQNTANNSNV